MKTLDIKGKPYVLVNERLKYFRENFKGWSLDTEIISLEDGICVMKATIKDPEGNTKATGHAYEKENSTFINKTSFIENCETSAWGRALGNLGIGIDTSIASAEEVLNAAINQNVPNNDKEILDGLKLLTTIAKLNSYYDENKKDVSDLKSFQTAYMNRAKEIKGTENDK